MIIVWVAWTFNSSALAYRRITLSRPLWRVQKWSFQKAFHLFFIFYFFVSQVAYLVPVLTSMIKRGLLSGGYLTGETQAPTALCLAPTRELAVQIHREVCKFANETVVTAAVCYGGVSVRHQADKIRRGCHFLVATPGRLIDFVDSNRVGNINFCNNWAISPAVATPPGKLQNSRCFPFHFFFLLFYVFLCFFLLFFQNFNCFFF